MTWFQLQKTYFVTSDAGKVGDFLDQYGCKHLWQSNLRVAKLHASYQCITIYKVQKNYVVSHYQLVKSGFGYSWLVLLFVLLSYGIGIYFANQ